VRTTTRAGAAGLALGVVLVLVLVACGSTVESPRPRAALDATPAASATADPTLTPGIDTAVAIDPSLLAILPVSVDGLEVVENPAGEAAALGDPLLAKVGSAIAAGFAIDPGSGDFVYAIVIRFLPDTMDAASFADFRATFDEGACSQADGVARSAETQIGGRTVYIGTCAGGLRTYHVWLEDRGVLISASAVGERRLGELLVRNLRL
jgi:hypothetical protein